MNTGKIIVATGIAGLLLAKGADVDAKDSQGRTALWDAEQRGRTEIAELLRKHDVEE